MTTKNEVRSTVEALILALKALEYIDRQDNDRDFLSPEECCDLDDAINTIRVALASKSEALMSFQDGASEANHAPTEREQPRGEATLAPSGEQQSAERGEPVAIGWQRRDGTLHRGCPPIGEDDGWTPLYTTPPQRTPDLSEVKRIATQLGWKPPSEWQGLTDEGIEDDWERITGHSIFGGDRTEGRAMYLSPDEVIDFARAIEAKLKEKNGF